jgi:DNA replication complex GINS protein SLD5 C-terminus
LLFLQEYGLLLEGHLQQTVTNHFPQEAWKALDEPHMISPPAAWLEGYVFCHVNESCTIDNGGGESGSVGGTSQFSPENNVDDDDDDVQEHALQYHKAGDCIIVRYHKIRSLLQEGKVELLI